MGAITQEPYIEKNSYGSPVFKQSFEQRLWEEGDASGSNKNRHYYGMKISAKDSSLLPTGIEKMILDIYTNDVADRLFRDASLEKMTDDVV